MKKRLLSILLTVCMVMAMLPGVTITASAAAGGYFTADITVGGADVPCTFRVLTEDAGSSTGTVQIGDGTASAIPNNTAGTIIIPSSVSDEGITYTVTKVGNYAFYRCDDLTGTLDIPATVTSIGSNAFYYCSGFTGELSIPASVTSIGDYAFAYWTGASAINFSEGALTSIGMGAFYYSSGFTGALTIPNSVTSIGEGAFNNCSGFTGTLTIPNSVTSIGDYAFTACAGFTGTLTIPASVTSIGYMTFSGCSGFTGALTIPNLVTSIGSYAFNGCNGFTGALTIPNLVTSIGDRAFENCTGFTGALTISDSVTSIGNRTFSGCTGFTGALTIPDSVTSIGDYAFLNCRGFTGPLTIPNSVTSIGDYAFYECTGFTGALTISASVTSIGSHAFYYCSGFTGALPIPALVTSIGSNAFRGCSGFTGTLTIPASVTSIGASAFNNCFSITALELQADILPATIGSDTFYACVGVNKLIVPATWTGGASVTLSGISSPFTGSKLIKDAGLDSVLGETLSTPAGGSGVTTGTPITWSIDVANDVTQVASTDIVPSTGSTAALYSNTAFTANEGASIALAEGGATTAYIKVTGDDTGTVRYHAVTINHAAVAPGAPTSVTATAGDTQAMVSFTAPASNGGATITEYTVTSSPGGITATGIDSPITITGLTNGQAYTFTVTATNSAGTGAASAASNSITPAATQTITFMNPGAQTFGTSPTLTATADSGLDVTFTSATPAVATITPDGVLTFVTAGTATINANQAGNSSYLPAAEVSRTFTVNPVVSGAPADVIATRGDTQASVSFTAPASNGGAAITGYTVTSSPGGYTATGAGSPITITGLTNGIVYTFTVTATNSAGTGVASEASNSVTPLASSPSGGGGGRTPALVTKIQTGESVTGNNVENLVKEGKNLTVEGKAGEKLIFDTEALKNIDSQTKESIRVEIKDVSADYQNEHPDRLVVSLTITAGGKKITSFGKGTATVSLPYELKEGEKAEDVTVWHLAEDGTMTEVPCTYDPVTKRATFKVSHFSLYVVGTADAAAWINPFGDVTESDWFYSAVEYANRNGLFAGTGADKFSPNSPMTRAMLWTVLGRLDGQSLSGSGVFDAASSWAMNAGITDGTNPSGDITREQMVSILWRYAGSPGAVGGLSKFSDAGNVANYATDAIAWAVENNIIAGTNGSLMPRDKAARAQVAAILQRFIEAREK